MEIGKFIKVIRDEDVKEIIVKTKDCIYRWTEDATLIAPIKTNSETHSATMETDFVDLKDVWFSCAIE